MILKGLTSKAPRVFLDRNCEKLPLFRATRKKLFFQHSTVQICSRLLWKCVEKNSKTLTTWIERVFCSMLEEKVFFNLAQQGQQPLAPPKVRFLHYT